MVISFCSKEWFEGAPPLQNLSVPTRIFAVISHCYSDTLWISRFLNRTGQLQHVDITSKCGQHPNWISSSVSHYTSPNKGRNDHTYAQWIVQNAHKLLPDDVVFFMKDTHHVHQLGSKFESFENMYRIVAGGFACGTRPSEMSIFHNTTILGTFIKNGYKGTTFDNIGSLNGWWAQMNMNIPRPFTPVCYGGHFATTGRQLQRVDPSVWDALMRGLENGDNIAEGHYAERSWAALLSPKLQCDVLDKIRSCAKGTVLRYYAGHLGTLTRCNDTSTQTKIVSYCDKK